MAQIQQSSQVETTLDKHRFAMSPLPSAFFEPGGNHQEVTHHVFFSCFFKVCFHSQLECMNQYIQSKIFETPSPPNDFQLIQENLNVYTIDSIWAYSGILLKRLVKPMAEPEPPCPEATPASVWDDERLEPGSLAHLWEKELPLRMRMHDAEFPYLTRWVRNKQSGAFAIGVASVKAMALNTKVLEVVANWYCPVQKYPKALPIDILRREVGS